MNETNGGGPNVLPEYIPPPPMIHPFNEETSLTNDNYKQNEDNKFAGTFDGHSNHREPYL